MDDGLNALWIKLFLFSNIIICAPVLPLADV